MMNSPTPQAVIAYFDRIGEARIMPRLGAVQDVLRRLGDPHKTFSSILIAGTNGKGSTGAMLESILDAAGHRVGFFQSPHLGEMTERFHIGGRAVGDTELAESVARVCCRLGESPERFGDLFDRTGLTYFEWNTVIAFDLFAQAGIDIAVLEVGLGGRLDSTNTVDPLLSIVTPVGLDHQRFLGRTKREILGEKLGITRPGTPLVTTIADRDLIPLIEEYVRERNIPLHRLGHEMKVHSLDLERFTYRDMDNGARPREYRTPLPGAHQHGNAAAAIRACRLLDERGIRIDPAALEHGLARARFPGRLERVCQRPAIWLDGGHNPLAARALARFARDLGNGVGLRVLATATMGHPLKAFLRGLTAISDTVTVAALPHPRGVPAPELKRAWEEIAEERPSGGFGWDEDVLAALHTELHALQPHDRLLVCGSLFLIEPARRVIREVYGASTGESHD